MAKLSAHGSEVGRVYFTTFAKAYMADGKILKNSGSGWKLFGKCKEGISPLQAYQSQKEKQEAFLDARPCLKQYRKALLDLAGLKNAWKLHAAIDLLGDDIDGIWSETCDGYGDNIHADCDEIAELVRLYKAVVEEKTELADPTNCLQ